MILLIRSKVDPALFQVGMIDAPGNGSQISLYQNVIESCSLLNPFEQVFDAIYPRFKAFGYEIFEVQHFTETVKPFYQLLRHGLAFDWTLNHVLSKVYSVFPFFTFSKFKGTDPFIDSNQDDLIFKQELEAIDTAFDSLLSNLFGELDKTVFSRFVKDSGSSNFMECVRWARTNQVVDNYYITENLIYNMNYLVALGLMLEHCIGVVKRLAWHDAFDKIRQGELDGLLVCGGKFRVFAYGRLNRETKWHRFDLGIQYSHESCRTLRDGNMHVFPDEMTFFRFNPNALVIDESMFPEVSFDEGLTWYNPVSFKEAELEIDKPLRMMIRYNFPQTDETRTIKVKGKDNCILKDAELVLDRDGQASTQVVFRSESIGFKVSETKKEYPFAMFTNNKLKIKDFEWL